jgi:hypothetical protein
MRRNNRGLRCRGLPDRRSKRSQVALLEERGVQQWDDAKPGFRWPISVAQPIPAPRSKVWDAISKPGNLEDFHPFCAANPVTVWPGDASRDEVHYLSGWVFERRFCQWIDGVGYDLDIGRPDGPSSFVSWRILSVEDERCVLRIAVYPHVLQDFPAAIRWLPHVLRLGPMLRSYLSSVVRGCEWYVTRGEPVPRNQFGPHPWFSAPESGRATFYEGG